jgi:hypothetical protein
VQVQGAVRTAAYGHSATHLEHEVLVLLVDGELFEEHDGKDEELDVAALEHAHEMLHERALAHAALHGKVLCKVEQHIEAEVQQAVLLLDHIDQPFLLARQRHLALLRLHDLRAGRAAQRQRVRCRAADGGKECAAERHSSMSAHGGNRPCPMQHSGSAWSAQRWRQWQHLGHEV